MESEVKMWARLTYTVHIFQIVLILSNTHPIISILKINISQHALRGGRGINLNSSQILQQVEMRSRMRPNRLEIWVTDISAGAHNSPGFLGLTDVLVLRLVSSQHNILSSYGTIQRPRELYEDFCRDWSCVPRLPRNRPVSRESVDLPKPPE